MLKIVQSISIIAIILATLVAPPNLDCDCGYDPLVADLLDQASQARWVQWIAELSGAESIQTESGEAVITSRSSHILLNQVINPALSTTSSTNLKKWDLLKTRIM